MRPPARRHQLSQRRGPGLSGTWDGRPTWGRRTDASCAGQILGRRGKLVTVKSAPKIRCRNHDAVGLQPCRICSNESAVPLDVACVRVPALKASAGHGRLRPNEPARMRILGLIGGRLVRFANVPSEVACAIDCIRLAYGAGLSERVCHCLQSFIERLGWTCPDHTTCTNGAQVIYSLIQVNRRLKWPFTTCSSVQTSLRSAKPRSTAVA